MAYHGVIGHKGRLSSCRPVIAHCFFGCSGQLGISVGRMVRCSTGCGGVRSALFAVPGSSAGCGGLSRRDGPPHQETFIANAWRTQLIFRVSRVTDYDVT